MEYFKYMIMEWKNKIKEKSTYQDLLLESKYEYKHWIKFLMN